MQDIQKRELLRSIKLIQSLGCSFRIITPDGESFGELEVVKKKQEKERIRPLRFPYGEVTKHIRKHLDMNAPVGSVQEIPAGAYGSRAIQGTLCSILSTGWGGRTYTTVTHEDRVELMRTAEAEVREEVA